MTLAPHTIEVCTAHFLSLALRTNRPRTSRGLQRGMSDLFGYVSIFKIKAVHSNEQPRIQNLAMGRFYGRGGTLTMCVSV